MKTEPVKHLKITEGKVFASSMEEPKKFGWKTPKRIRDEDEAFNASFVEVEDQDECRVKLYEYGLTDLKPNDGLYPAPDGLVMKVYPKPIKEEFEREGLAVRFPEKWEHGSTMWDWTQKVAVLSFTQSKEKESCQPNQCLYPNCNCSNPPKAEDKTAQPYFKLSTNEYGKHWLFYKPLKSEPGKYGCWMPIDDEFYAEFLKMQKAFEQSSMVKKLREQRTEHIHEIVRLNEECANLQEQLNQKI